MLIRKKKETKEKFNDAELRYSKEFHQIGIPILVSPTFLRQRDMGQIDLARMNKNRNNEQILEVCEVKSKNIPSPQQMKRVGFSADFLSRLFNLPIILKFKVVHQSEEDQFI